MPVPPQTSTGQLPPKSRVPDAGTLVSRGPGAMAAARVSAATGGGGPSAADGVDETLSALDELLVTLRELRVSEGVLIERVQALRDARRAGSSWRQAVEDEDDPGTVQLVSGVLAQLAGSSGRLRRAMAAALRREGASIPRIADLFGVTHQRVSNLLRRPQS